MSTSPPEAPTRTPPRFVPTLTERVEAAVAPAIDPKVRALMQPRGATEGASPVPATLAPNAARDPLPGASNSLRASLPRTSQETQRTGPSAGSPSLGASQRSSLNLAPAGRDATIPANASAERAPSPSTEPPAFATNTSASSAPARLTVPAASPSSASHQNKIPTRSEQSRSADSGRFGHVSAEAAVSSSPSRSEASATAAPAPLRRGASTAYSGAESERAVPFSAAQASEFEEMLVHRVLQRVDVALDHRLRRAIASVVEEHLLTLLPKLREEVEGVVRRAVNEGVADELASQSKTGVGGGFH